MKRNRMMTGIMVGAAVLALGATAVAHGRGDREDHREKGKKHDRIGRIIESLDLTIDQKTKLGNIRAQTIAKVKPIKEKLRVLKEQERAVWNSDKPDENQILALRREVRSLKGELDELRIAQQFDIMEVLTRPVDNP